MWVVSAKSPNERDLSFREKGNNNLVSLRQSSLCSRIIFLFVRGPSGAQNASPQKKRKCFQASSSFPQPSVSLYRLSWISPNSFCAAFSPWKVENTKIPNQPPIEQVSNLFCLQLPPLFCQRARRKMSRGLKVFFIYVQQTEGDARSAHGNKAQICRSEQCRTQEEADAACVSAGGILYKRQIWGLTKRRKGNCWGFIQVKKGSNSAGCHAVDGDRLS